MDSYCNGIMKQLNMKIIKTINKFNGNFCFVGSTDSGDIIFECDRQNNVLNYATSSIPITGICLNDLSSYFVVFGNNWIGRFQNGVLNETYVNTEMDMHKIVKSADSDIYVLNGNTNQLTKFTIND